MPFVCPVIAHGVRPCLQCVVPSGAEVQVEQVGAPLFRITHEHKLESIRLYEDAHTRMSEGLTLHLTRQQMMGQGETNLER